MRALSLVDSLESSGNLLTKRELDNARAEITIESGPAPRFMAHYCVNVQFKKDSADADELWSLPKKRLAFLLKQHESRIEKIYADSYASKEGSPDHNLTLTEERCAGFAKKWQNVLESDRVSKSFTDKFRFLACVAHGEDDSPYVEKHGMTKAELQRVREKNRVVIIHFFVESDRSGDFCKHDDE